MEFPSSVKRVRKSGILAQNHAQAQSDLCHNPRHCCSTTRTPDQTRAMPQDSPPDSSLKFASSMAAARPSARALSPEEKLSGDMLMLTTGFMMCAAALWLAIYWSMGYQYSTAIPLIFQALSVVTIGLWWKFRRLYTVRGDPAGADPVHALRDAVVDRQLRERFGREPVGTDGAGGRGHRARHAPVDAVVLRLALHDGDGGRLRLHALGHRAKVRPVRLSRSSSCSISPRSR